MHADTSAAIRAQLIAAMQQRAAGLDGEARRAVETRLAKLCALDADAQREAPDTHPTTSPTHSLRELLAHEAPAQHAAYPDIPALAEFRQLWSTLRADSQLQQSVAHTATDAGPLNSTALASRAIALMREVSPGYLRSFLAYVDDLSWLEQLGGAGSTTATSPATAKKRARRKPQA